MIRLFIFLMCFSLVVKAQDNRDFIELELELYEPKKKIKKVLKNLSSNPKCFWNSNEKLSDRQHILTFNYEEDKNQYTLVTKSSEKQLYKTLVDWNSYNISGVMYYKDDLVLLEFNNDEEKNRKPFVRIKQSSIKVKIPIADKVTEYSCRSIYEVKGCNFKLIEKMNSWTF
jgi:hypothetical protein